MTYLHRKLYPFPLVLLTCGMYRRIHLSISSSDYSLLPPLHIVMESESNDNKFLVLAYYDIYMLQSLEANTKDNTKDKTEQTS